MRLAVDTNTPRRRGKNGVTLASFQCTRRMLELIRKEAEDRGETMSAYMRSVIENNLIENRTKIQA
jgi:hypothetical protein